jgi:hypothetical protein
MDILRKAERGIEIEKSEKSEKSEKRGHSQQFVALNPSNICLCQCSEPGMYRHSGLLPKID